MLREPRVLLLHIPAPGTQMISTKRLCFISTWLDLHMLFQFSRLLLLENFEDALLNISADSPYLPYLACVRNVTDNLARGSQGNASLNSQSAAPCSWFCSAVISLSRCLLKKEREFAHLVSICISFTLVVWYMKGICNQVIILSSYCC